MYNYEMVNEIGKNVVRRIGHLAFAAFEVYILITVLIPILMTVKTIFKALMLITILVYCLNIMLMVSDAIM